jgi:hypothetical protein
LNSAPLPATRWFDAWRLSLLSAPAISYVVAGLSRLTIIRVGW